VKFDVTDCSHVFHRHCIESSIRMSKLQCPTCRRPIREVRGFSPSGTMSIYTTREACNGHESSIGTIIIDYRLPTDIQRQYHPNPGKSFYGTMRTAYLPDNKEGKELLLRLKYAWLKGLCFTVGTSMTTGRSNVITWSSVHHKTSMYGGVHGYPDPQFFWNCNFELDGLGVPKAQDVQTSPHLLEPPPYRVEQSTSTSSSASMSTTSQVLPHSSNSRAQLSNSVAAAVASMTNNGSTPSQLQLENGLSILNIIRNKINGADVSDGYEELSSRFYSTIPHSFGHQSPPVISTLSFLQERYDACIHLMNS
jgi:deltex-like protein